MTLRFTTKDEKLFSRECDRPPGLSGRIQKRAGPLLERQSNFPARLLLENHQMILGVGQLSDTDRIAPEDLGRDIGRIIARTENNDPSARKLLQQTFEIAICRNQDKVVSRGIVQNPTISGACEPVSKRTFGPREQVAQ